MNINKDVVDYVNKLQTKRNPLMKIIKALSLIPFLLSGGAMAMGEKYSEQGHALYKALMEEMMVQGRCKNFQNCSDIFQIYGEHGNKVNLNMYSGTDPERTGSVVKFIVQHGIKITKGVPITLRVLPGSHDKYIGFKYAFGFHGEESIILEINK